MKKALFFENARLLNEKFNISPLMYGSLGLEYITGEMLNADDIDILIPEWFINAGWADFNNIMEACSYRLVDEHEHTFEKDEICYSYASIEELKSFAGIRLSDIKEHNKDGAKFKLLTIEQYLKVYTASCKDGYRINVRKKKDEEKIALIENILSD